MEPDPQEPKITYLGPSSGGGPTVSAKQLGPDEIARIVQEVKVKQGLRAFDPTGGKFSDQVADTMSHPVESLPAIGAMAATVAAPEVSLPILAGIAGLGAMAGEGGRQIIDRTVYNEDLGASADAADSIVGQGALNAALTLFTGGAVKGLRPFGRWQGRSVLKTPVPILRDVPGFEQLGEQGAKDAIVDKAYDKGWIPGTATGARNARIGPGGARDLNAQVKAELQRTSAAGVTHDIRTEVAPVFREILAKKQPFPEDMAAAVNAKYAELLRNPEFSEPIPGSLTGARRFRRDITPERLNDLKSAGYQKIDDVAWTKEGSPEVEVEKAATARMGKAVKDKNATVAGLLDDESMVIPTARALDRGASRIKSGDPIRLKEAVAPDLGTAMLLALERGRGGIGFGADRLGRSLENVPGGAGVSIMELLKTALENKLRSQR